MQLLSSPQHHSLRSIEAVLQRQRLERYIAAAGSRERDALFRFYLWNCALSEAFYLPLQFAEVACRNAIHRALLEKLGEQWFQNTTLMNLLSDRYKAELRKCISEERADHGVLMTAHHVCSALTFGFWEHLTTKRFGRLIWQMGVSRYFTNAPPRTELVSLHDLIESVRRWRNRIAHHKAVFDKGPSRKHQDLLLLLRWVSPETADWVGSISRVQRVIDVKPARESTANQFFSGCPVCVLVNEVRAPSSQPI